MPRQSKPETEMAKTTLRLPADLWRAVRIRAINENRDAQDIVADALRAYVARQPKKGGSR